MTLTRLQLFYYRAFTFTLVFARAVFPIVSLSPAWLALWATQQTSGGVLLLVRACVVTSLQRWRGRAHESQP